MSRCALLSTCGDPFILLFCLKLWQERWYEEIDKMYINYNNHCGIPDEVIGETLTRLVKDPKIHLIYHPNGLGNGPPQVENLLIAKEDLILLLEDDFFLYTPGIIDEYFKKIELGETDLLGSPRYTYGEVAEAAKVKYNLNYEGIGDRGFGFWPTGFYCKRSDLLRTDLDFGSKKYSKGEYFKELDYTFKEDNYTDTFTWTSLQLRYMGLRYIDIPQYHADVYGNEEKKPYIHGGSLSAGWGGYLSGRIPDVSHEAAKQEMESRVAFWDIALHSVEGFNKFKVDYQIGITDLIHNAQLDAGRIDRKINIYKNLMRI